MYEQAKEKAAEVRSHRTSESATATAEVRRAEWALASLLVKVREGVIALF